MYEGNIYMTVDGISDTIRGIKKYDYDLHESIRAKISEYAKKIQKKAKELAPVKTGALRRSITVKTYHNGMTAHIFPSDEKMRKANAASNKRQTYRHFVEYGTMTRYTKTPHPIFGTYRGRMSGKRYMATARITYQDSFEGAIESIIDRKVVV